MKKILSFLLLCGFMFSSYAQWSPTKAPRNSQKEISAIGNSYKLDLALLQSQLKNAQEMGANAKSVEISIPTLSGKVEKFAVYSFPVMEKELADQYQLGSYTGIAVGNPGKQIRFSVSPTSFQSMIFNNGSFEFIDPMVSDKSTYLVHPKTIDSGGKTFNCSTGEDPTVLKQMNSLLKMGSHFTNDPTNFAKNSDQKYRTLKLALSVTGEYTQFHGGTVAAALAAMNATMTRVNGVFEKDFALHLNIQNFPQLIYTNPNTDPYTSNLNAQLQQNLTNTIGNAAYDIGHIFNAAGGNGNAGCIGCICISPTTSVPLGKGSAFTQSTSPIGDTFDIDYVAHEMGHQLGATHTFTHVIQGGGTSMEPGSGSTIMGYAGITGPDTDVQQNSDSYFHAISIVQVQSNLISKTCDVETVISNGVPVIGNIPAYTIPKGTAFVLSAAVTDPNNDPTTYVWEQVDNATASIDKFNIGTTNQGPSFRSMPPLSTSNGSVRYFPRLSSVLAGVLDNSNNLWEAVPTVARSMQFAITVRDNNPAFNQQQTINRLQNMTVGNDGPFTVNTTTGANNIPAAVNWTVANTSAAPYNAANVKIDYTTNGGATWVTLIASTPNDGSENVQFTGVPSGTSVKLRVSAIGNIFYAVSTVNVFTVNACTGAAPTNLAASAVTANSASLSWGPITGATYTVRYRVVGSPTWVSVNSNTSSLALSGLTSGTAYEFQVSATCSGTTSPFSASGTFTTSSLVYCVATTTDATFEYISNVTLANINNTSGASTYTNYTTNSALQINMTAGTQYTLSVTKDWLAGGADYDAVSAWIDFNNNGVFEDSERVLAAPVTNTTTPVTAQFTVPAAAVTGVPTRMRVIDIFAGSANAGAILTNPCGTFQYGEVEDYQVVIAPDPLSTNETINVNDGIQIYPNPASDVLNITNVSDKTTYEIYSVAGQIVGKGTIKDGKVNVSKLTTGNYILKISDKDVDLSFKFIKR